MKRKNRGERETETETDRQTDRLRHTWREKKRVVKQA